MVDKFNEEFGLRPIGAPAHLLKEKEIAKEKIRNQEQRRKALIEGYELDFAEAEDEEDEEIDEEEVEILCVNKFHRWKTLRLLKELKDAVSLEGEQSRALVARLCGFVDSLEALEKHASASSSSSGPRSPSSRSKSKARDSAALAFCLAKSSSNASSTLSRGGNSGTGEEENDGA